LLQREGDGMRSVGTGESGRSYDCHRTVYPETTRTLSHESLGLLEILENRIDGFEGVIDLLTNLGTSQDNLSTNEYEQNDLGLDHSVDETRE